MKSKVLNLQKMKSNSNAPAGPATVHTYSGCTTIGCN